MPARAFAAHPSSVPAAREYVSAALGHLPAHQRDTAALLTSELATNAVRHGGGPDFEVSVQHLPGADRLWVGVTESGAGYPLLRRPPVTAGSGRGLQLVGLFAERWGVRRRRGEDAKTVWFELAGSAQSEPVDREPEPSS